VYLRCDGVVNNQIKKGLLLSLSVKRILKGVNIWQSYKQERGCLLHFARLANTLLKDEESARDSHVVPCNFAKYLPIKKFTDQLSDKSVLIWLLTTPSHLKCVATLPCNLSSNSQQVLSRRTESARGVDVTGVEQRGSCNLDASTTHRIN